ncbi:MAG: Coenzyme F420 hydrogenase/dehydrogenase, beta subunit C-terminal domain [Candidatus Thermoplasmatota archaeon]
MQHGLLKIKNDDVSETVNEFLRELLASKKISALLVPQMVPSKKTVFPVLISDPKKLSADVFAPVLPVSTATMVSKITKHQAPSTPIAVVLHPCQIRALIELTKLNQARLENIILIGVDCLGTYPVTTYAVLAEKKNPTKQILETLTKKTSDTESKLRTACKVCTEPIPGYADMSIGLYGMHLEKEILIQAHTDAGKKLISEVTLEDAQDKIKHRDQVVKKICEEREKAVQSFIHEKAGSKGIEALTKFFDTCSNCHNCMKACPICYCKECLFDSSIFDAEGNKFIRKAEQKGLFKMPSDVLLFHVGRMNHMILSCVKCGLCEQACPSLIPLMDIFIPAAVNAQKEFTYHPGKDKDEKIPMIVYREDEYTDVGEA